MDVVLMHVGGPAPFSPGVLISEVVAAAPLPFSLVEFSVEPRGASDAGSHPLAEIWHIVLGLGRVTTDEGTLEVKAGDLVYLRPNVVHRLENRGDEVMRALSITWQAPA